MAEYALYKGEEFLSVGTILKISKEAGLSESYLRKMRIEGYTDNYDLIKMEDDKVVEDILEGFICETCGVFLDGESPGYPRKCDSCETEVKRDAKVDRNKQQSDKK